MRAQRATETTLPAATIVMPRASQMPTGLRSTPGASPRSPSPPATTHLPSLHLVRGRLGRIVRPQPPLFADRHRSISHIPNARLGQVHRAMPNPRPLDLLPETRPTT